MQSWQASAPAHSCRRALPCAGIVLHERFDANATGLLLTEGILDALAAGALLQVALSGPMNALKTNVRWLGAQRRGVRYACFAAFVAGAAAMSYIGKWA